MAADLPIPPCVYRDRWLLVLDKPHGLDSQALYRALRPLHEYVGLLHRLDQPSSGLLLFTLREEANRPIARGLRDHSIARTYRAVLAGEAEDALWTWPLQGKDAGTALTALSTRNGMSAVECSLRTGRTHQIRQHAAMAGTPIAGDRRYGAEAGRAWPRLALHACGLDLDHPVTGARVRLRSPIPDDLIGLWQLAGGEVL